MKAIISGANGTIGSELSIFLKKCHWEVIPWNRELVSVTDYHAMKNFISQHQPDVFFHLAAITSMHEKDRENAWQINYEWPSELAWICRELQIKFIFTSSSSVFGNNFKGPISVDSEPDVVSGYGFEKRMAEKRVLSQNPDSVILRLGWQISPYGKNTINHYIGEISSDSGKMEASTLWFPSCSFLNDTVKVLFLALDFEPGIYQLNSNSHHNFFEIVRELCIYFLKNVEIIPVAGFRRDDRMVDNRISITDICLRLPGLP